MGVCMCAESLQSCLTLASQMSGEVGGRLIRKEYVY